MQPNRKYTEAEIQRQMVAAKFLLQSLENQELDDDFKHDIIEGETEFFEAIEIALDEVRDCEIAEAGLRLTIEKLEGRKRRHRARRERLRGLIEQAMVTADVKSHAFPCETLTVKPVGGKVLVTSESLIPAMFWEPQPPKLNLQKLHDTLKLTSVSGAKFSNGGVSLQIRKS